MPKTGQRAEVNTFIQGLITEASPLNFPPNASKEEENFILNRDGTRNRRLGMDVEEGFPFVSTSLTALNVESAGKNTFKWTSVSGIETLEILVVQLLNELTFYKIENDLLTFLDTFVCFSFSSTVSFSFASIEGKLVVAAGENIIEVISYDVGLGSVSAIEQTLKVRDFWGMEVPSSLYETDKAFRDVSIPAEHRYNLQNQSWGIARKDKAGTLGDPIELYDPTTHIHPSNSEVVWTGLQYQPIVGATDPFERIYPNLYVERLGANINAPKGYYIIDVLDRGESREEEFAANYTRSGSVLTVPSLSAPADKTLGGATVITEFAGRVFYAGFSGELEAGDARSPNLSNFILFSQLVKSASDLPKCYQDGDPTSRDTSDIVDTDGGFVRIAGAKKILSLQKMGSSLIVLSDNGIWAVSGGGDFGFTPTNFKVTKISTFGCISDSSVVSQGSTVAYWGVGGIYTISRDKFAELIVNNISQTTIQTYYDEITLTSKVNCVGVYNENTKKISWLFKEGVIFSEGSVTKELVLDTTLSCFYVNRIIGVPFSAPFFTRVECMLPFYTNRTIYLTLKVSAGIYGLAFSSYNNVRFREWETFDGFGVDAKAFLRTGSQIAGDSAVHKQVSYLVLHFKKTESVTDDLGEPLDQSSCLFSTYWDWSVNTNSNKVGRLQQGYRYRRPYFANLPNTDYDNGFELVTTKSKVRGRGRAFGLYFETEPFKDCNITGWNLTINGDAIA